MKWEFTILFSFIIWGTLLTETILNNTPQVFPIVFAKEVKTFGISFPMHVSYFLFKSVRYLLFRKINGKYKFSALISPLRLGKFHTLISLFLKGDTQMLGNLCIAWKPCYPSFHVFTFLSHSDIGFRCQTQSIFSIQESVLSALQVFSDQLFLSPEK